LLYVCLGFVGFDAGDFDSGGYGLLNRASTVSVVKSVCFTYSFTVAV